MQHAALYHPNAPFAKRRQSSNRCDGKNNDGERKCFPKIIGKGKKYAKYDCSVQQQIDDCGNVFCPEKVL